MGCTTFDLHEKDVINICNGNNLGKVTELEIDVDCGKVTALIVAPEGFASVIFSRNQIRVPWEKITKMGKDTILVELPVQIAEKCDDCQSDMHCEKDKCEKKRKWWRF